MANNDFLPFAAGSGADVMSQAAYDALAARINGFSTGIAQPDQLNKVWRQSSIMAAVVAQFIADQTGQDAVDDGTTATLLANLKSAVGASSVGVVGSIRNGRMSVTTASSTATFSADEIIVESALGGLTYRLPSFSKTINLATAGAGGMDTGAAPTNGFVALYAIYNPSSGTSALLATNTTAAVAPEVYSGANMPAGYTASSLVSVWPTDPTGKLKVGYQEDRNISFPQLNVLSTTSLIGSLTALPVGGVVPRNAVRCSGIMAAAATAGSGGVGVNVASDSNGSKLQPLNGYVGSSSGSSVAFHDLPLKTAQTLYYTTSAAGPTAYAFNIGINGYSI